MVYWIVMSQNAQKKRDAHQDAKSVGPYESYDVAREALQNLRTRITHQINSRIVVDYG